MSERAVGVLGGTFDPIHLGHIGLATDVQRGLELETVRVIPAGDPPHRAKPFAAPEHRLAMAILACAQTPGLVVDDREMRRAGASYTVDTLRELRGELGATPLALIVGSDAFAGLHRWHRWQELFSFAHVVVAERPGLGLDVDALPPLLEREWRARYRADARVVSNAPAGAIVRQAITPRPISATAIRAALAEGPAGHDRVRGLLPSGVLDYIARSQLYRT